jgi:hypothetical protein
VDRNRFCLHRLWGVLCTTVDLIDPDTCRRDSLTQPAQRHQWPTRVPSRYSSVPAGPTAWGAAAAVKSSVFRCVGRKRRSKNWGGECL